MRFLDRTTSTPDTSVRGLTRSRPALMEVVDLQTIFADAVPGNPLLDRDDQNRGEQTISALGIGGVAPRDYTRGGGGRGSSVSDHGALLGLADDDHPNYLNLSRGDNRYYQKTAYIDTSAGSAQAGEPIVLDADGDIDDSMIPLDAVGSLLVGEGTQADRLSVGDDETILVADAAQDLGMSWVTPAVLAATLDHGLLLGLNDADHNAVYYTETELDAGKLDNRYFTETEHRNTSSGSGDAGKPIKLDANGHIDATMINDADVDHGGLGGLADDDHTIYSLVDGTRAFTGTVGGVDPDVSSELATKEYVDRAIHFVEDYFLNDTASDIGGIYYDMEETSTGGGETTFLTGPLTNGDGQALTNWATLSGIPGVITFEEGIYTGHIHAEVTVGNKPVQLYCEIWTRTSGGAETLRVTSEVSELITSKVEVELHIHLHDDIVINSTDRYVVKWYANVGVSGSNVTIAIYAEGTTASRTVVPITTEVLSHIFVRQDGDTPLTDNWDVGDKAITNISGLGVGTATPVTSAILELVSTTGAFLNARMNTTQRDALTAVDGMQVYNTTTGEMNYHKAGAWVAI